MSRSKTNSLSYRAAGVDIDKGDRFVRKIAPLARRTLREEVMAPLGGFGSLVRLPRGYREPVLVAGTDGVGTKLKLAFALKKHDTIGIDLVAMCANDVVVQGAEPLFFLDYLATGKLDPNAATQIVDGIARGCRQAGCSLVGGETAEMPGFYRPGEYDVAGFCVGVAERKRLLPQSAKLRAGDVIVGVASSGVHSNGFSLVRKILMRRRLSLRRVLPDTKKPLGEHLLAPTKIYVALALRAMEALEVKAFAHITGGGLPGNLPRVLPPSLRAVVDRQSWPRGRLFQFLQEQGRISDKEMLRTFNCGVGFCLIVPESAAARAIDLCRAHKHRAWPIGVLERRRRGASDFEILW